MNNALEFQMLACRVRVQFEDPTLREALRYFVLHAQQPFEIRKTFSYEVSGTGPYDIFEEGDLCEQVRSRLEVLHIVYGRVYRRLLERFVLADWVVLHGALATVNGSRMLFLGDKGAGKTTLATRLLYENHRLEGDEMVLVKDGKVMAVPRNFHLKPRTERQIPELADILPDLPKTAADGFDVAAFDPTLHGFTWKINVGPVDAVVWITANHGGETELRPLTSFPMLQKVLNSSLGWGESRGGLVSEANRLASRGGFELVFGDAQEAVLQLGRL